MSAVTALVHRAGRAYLSKITADEATTQRFTRINERPIEYGFTFQWLNRLQPQTVLDVGTGDSALPALLRTCGFVVTAIDNVRDYWPKGMVNRHWFVRDENITQPNGSYTYDAITCISVLEHIGEPLAAIRGLHQRATPGGHVILTTTYGPDGHPNVYTLPGSYGTHQPYICRQFCPVDLNAWLTVGFDLIAADYWRAFDSSYWSVGTLIRPLESTETPAHLGCFVFRRR